MRVSVVQMNAGADKMANIDQARALIEAAVAADRPGIVSLPEVWSCMGGDRDGKFRQAEELPPPGSNLPGGEAYEFLRKTARDNQIFVHGGSIGEKGGDRLFNTTLVFNPNGTEIARYRKIHLFDISTPDGLVFGESRTYAPGNDIVSYEAGGLKVGCAICYDVRFPELFLKLRQAGAGLIFLPAAFTLQTGKDHWETLIRARAIETQCWFAAPAMYGPHKEANGETRTTYGHSMLVDPWGHVVAKVSDGTGWATARIDLDLTQRIRRDMPVMNQRKLV